MTWNTQALGFSSQGPPAAPPFLSCPDVEDPGPNSPGPLARPHTALRPTLLSRKYAPPNTSGRSGPLGPPAIGARREGPEALLSAEILEAACNASIPGLTGVSNFTVFLYCNLFSAENGSGAGGPAAGGPDLHATCSDAAWYLWAAEEDFLWVHVCSEFFAQEFNNTVCANSSFWLQRAHQVGRKSLPFLFLVLLRYLQLIAFIDRFKLTK